jgi:hypothetical protein
VQPPAASTMGLKNASSPTPDSDDVVLPGQALDENSDFLGSFSSRARQNR